MAHTRTLEMAANHVQNMELQTRSRLQQIATLRGEATLLTATWSHSAVMQAQAFTTQHTQGCSKSNHDASSCNVELPCQRADTSLHSATYAGLLKKQPRRFQLQCRATMLKCRQKPSQRNIIKVHHSTTSALLRNLQPPHSECNHRL